MAVIVKCHYQPPRPDDLFEVDQRGLITVRQQA